MTLGCDTNYTIQAQTLVTFNRHIFHDSRHICMRFRTDGIKVMSHVFSGNKQMIKFAKVVRCPQLVYIPCKLGIWDINKVIVIIIIIIIP